MTVPFFVVGCGRSGTTLLRTMLDHHPMLAIPVESLFIIDYLRSAERVPLATVRGLILREFELKEWGIPLDGALIADCDSVPAIITRLHERYVEQHKARYWGQKTPRFVRYGDLLKRAYPTAKFINVLRDPRAVVNSLVRSNVHSSNVYYGAKRWLNDVNAGRQLKAAYPDDVLDVRYEDLVADTETVLRNICDFLGLPFDAAMLDYHRTGTADYGGYHEQIHARLNAPPSQDRIEAWRDKLTADEIALIESICAPLMTELGYQPEQSAHPIPSGMIRRLKIERMTSGLYKQVRQYFNGRTYHLFYSIWRKFRLGLLWRDLRQVNM